MRLATARLEGGTRLFLETSTGMLDVVRHAPQLEGIDDVGSLLRAGQAALKVVGALDTGRDGNNMVAFGDLHMAPPVVTPSKLICIGLNYRRHAAEGGEAIPTRPIIFAKFASSLIGSGENIVHPHITESLDYEGELGVVIGERASNLTVEEAGHAVAGFLVANDVSARDIQSGDPASQWVRGKSLNTFAPMGPYFVTADVVSDWRALQLRTWVNGELRQDEVCGDMVFGVEELVSFISQDLTLEPGDVILTGTPSGVGYAFTPPRWLRPGDVVEVEITGLGKLASPVVSQ
jgi:2-keto-4-pentenoate hydratase/2-oxohepta-3-ene-1,7-dioic acid hydratase in catechol pathway